MFRTRPPWFAITCICMWLLQLALLAVAVYGYGEESSSDRYGWEQAALVISVGLGALLLVQLPRALQWRPRLHARAGAEVTAERRRIAQDLHDNLGAQLVFAMSLLDAEPPAVRDLRSLLDKCMLDLRLVVDSMDGTDEPFADRLARLRHRIQPVLDQRGIHMAWDVQSLPRSCFPYADSSMHLVAIVQEALSNVLQHSGATEVTVSVHYRADAESWYAEVSDNGRGMLLRASDGSSSGGYGVAGMNHRAQMAGGDLLVMERPDGGTCVRVVMPCRVGA